MKRYAVLAVFVGLVWAQESKISDVQRYKMLNTYRKALASLNEVTALKDSLCVGDKKCIEKVAEANKLIEQFHSEEAEAAKAMGLPSGTKFNVLIETDEVTPEKAVAKK